MKVGRYDIVLFSLDNLSGKSLRQSLLNSLISIFGCLDIHPIIIFVFLILQISVNVDASSKENKLYLPYQIRKLRLVNYYHFVALPDSSFFI